MSTSKRIIKAATATTLALLMASALPGLAPGGLGSAQAASEETVRVGAKHVHIIRGDSVAFNPPASGAVAMDRPAVEPISGTFGWFIDHERNKLGNCFRLSTSEYRGWRIQCVWKDLP